MFDVAMDQEVRLPFLVEQDVQDTEEGSFPVQYCRFVEPVRGGEQDRGAGRDTHRDKCVPPAVVGAIRA